jgi:hypothetical protein
MRVLVQSSSSVVAVDDLCSCRFHLLNRAFAVAWIQIDGAHCVRQGFYLEAVLDPGKHCRFDAIIGGQPANDELFNTLIVKLFSQIGFIESGITISVAQTFGDDVNARIVFQLRVKLGAFRILHAVYRPRAAVRLKVLGLWRVPVAAFVDGIAALEKFVDQFVQGRDNFVTLGHRQCPTGTKIVLHINHD